MLKNLTKGGQTFFQSMRMFFAIFWKLVVAFTLIFIVSFAGLFYVKTTPYQRYEIAILVEAAPMSFLFHTISGGLDGMGLVSTGSAENSAKISFRYPDGQVVYITDDQAIKFIARPSFLHYLKEMFIWTSIQSGLIAFIISILIAILLIRFGQTMSKKKVLRGANICSANELKKLINRDNGKRISNLSIAGIPLPIGSEKQHIWINGSPGTGKTVLFSDIMNQIRNNKQRAIVYDIMGTYVSRFYRPGKDIILNPFDNRSPSWSPWVECKHSVDYEMLAASQIPIIPGVSHEDPFWKKASRSLYSATLRRLKKEGRARNIVLLRYLLTSDLDKLRELLENTEAESLVSRDLEKTALSVKAILNDYIKGMRFLKDEEPLFSIRDWVRKEDDSWIFITSRPDYHETLMPLISAWYDTAITEALSLPNNDSRRIYFPLDELPTLQYLPSLMKGMALGRQKGLCFILGTQNLSQLRVNYGAENSSSIIGNANTKMMLRTVNDADNIANLFNKSEYEENSESLSYGITDHRDGVSISKRRNMQYVILPSEFQNLNDLEGYFRATGNYPITKTKFEYVSYPEPNKSFELRDIDIDSLLDETDEPIYQNEEKEMSNKSSVYSDGLLTTAADQYNL